jgi:hypothetical protein
MPNSDEMNWATALPMLPYPRISHRELDVTFLNRRSGRLRAVQTACAIKTGSSVFFGLLPATFMMGMVWAI